MTLAEAQQIVKNWSKSNGWQDIPNIDKFDHLHEELIEMSQHLRYKSEPERIEYAKNHQDYFTAEMGGSFSESAASPINSTLISKMLLSL